MICFKLSPAVQGYQTVVGHLPLAVDLLCPVEDSGPSRSSGHLPLYSQQCEAQRCHPCG